MMPGAGPMPYMAGGAAARPQQDLMQSKSTTIYVGKIAATLDDDVMMKLLEACGKVKQWKPVKDPSNNQPKGFGFVEYEVRQGNLVKEVGLGYSRGANNADAVVLALSCICSTASGSFPDSKGQWAVCLCLLRYGGLASSPDCQREVTRAAANWVTRTMALGL